MFLDVSRHLREILLQRVRRFEVVGHRLDPLHHVHNDACTRRVCADRAASSPYKLLSFLLGTGHTHFLDTPLDHLLISCTSTAHRHFLWVTSRGAPIGLHPYPLI